MINGSMLTHKTEVLFLYNPFKMNQILWLSFHGLLKLSLKEYVSLLIGLYKNNVSVSWDVINFLFKVPVMPGYPVTLDMIMGRYK